MKSNLFETLKFMKLFKKKEEPVKQFLDHQSVDRLGEGLSVYGKGR